MTRSQRARHVVMWLVLLPVAAAVLLVALTARRADVARQRASAAHGVERGEGLTGSQSVGPESRPAQSLQSKERGLP